MKKYFLKETDEELQFGDLISIQMEKRLEDGRININKEIEFSEEVVEFLLDMGIIEEKDDEMLDVVEDACPCGYGKLLDELCEDQEELEKKVEEIEEEIEAQQKMLDGMMKDLKDCIENIKTELKKEKTDSSKKK